MGLIKAQGYRFNLRRRWVVGEREVGEGGTGETGGDGVAARLLDDLLGPLRRAGHRRCGGDQVKVQVKVGSGDRAGAIIKRAHP